MTSTALILAVYMTNVTYMYALKNVNDLVLYEFSNSVERAPTQWSGGHGFDSFQDSSVFFVSSLCHIDQFTFHISLQSLIFAIFIHS